MGCRQRALPCLLAWGSLCWPLWPWVFAGYGRLTINTWAPRGLTASAQHARGSVSTEAQKDFIIVTEGSLARAKQLREEADDCRKRAKKLRDQAEELRDQAKEFRDQANQFRKQGYREEAKELSVEAGKLMADAEKLAGEAEKLMVEAEKLEDQANKLSSARAAPEVMMLSSNSMEGEFTTALEGAVLNGKILTANAGSFQFNNRTELWNKTALYVRDCYVEIGDLMFHRGWPAHMTVLGSSGIGKSNMIPYILWRRWNDEELQQFPIYLHQGSKIIMYQKGQPPCRVAQSEVEFANPRSLYIIDSDVDTVIETSCTTLWIVSARRGDGGSEHFKAARLTGCQFMMPPWALEEMLNTEAHQLHCLSDDVVKERFERFGGSARCVLAVTEFAKTQCDFDLNQSLKSDNALQSLRVPASLKDLSRATHMLVKLHPLPGSEYALFEAKLSSKYVGQQLVKVNWIANRQELWSRIEDFAHTAIARTLYEEAWHRLMVQDAGNITLKCRRLSDGYEANKTFKCLKDMRWTNGDSEIVDGVYYQPLSPNFEAFDGWCMDGLFQVTLANSHEINLKGNTSNARKVIRKLREVLKPEGSRIPYYFLIPTESFLNHYTSEQRVMAGNKTAGQADTLLIEQWKCQFDREAFFR